MEVTANVAQEVSHLQLSAEKWLSMSEEGHAYTGIEAGTVYICSGIVPVWPGRWQLWSAVSKYAGPAKMLWIHRQALEWLDGMQKSSPVEFMRIEATAKADEPHSIRWLEMLGFEIEGRLRCYDANGNDHLLYARISCHLTPPR